MPSEDGIGIGHGIFIVGAVVAVQVGVVLPVSSILVAVVVGGICGMSDSTRSDSNEMVCGRF